MRNEKLEMRNNFTLHISHCTFIKMMEEFFMKRFRKLTAWLLTLAMLMTFIPSFTLTASAATEVYASGTLGQGNRTAWTIYDNGLLVIDGKGNTMTSINWDSTTASPWKNYADVITRISFANCENWKSLPAHSFKSLYNLKEVTLPENLEVIQQLALGYTGIETIELPQSLTTIGESAFSNCESLNYVNIHSGITKIGSGAFSDCVSLKAISIPDSVTSIGQTLFQNCRNLEYVRLSESVDKIGGSMFSGCTMLKNISLPASVTVIGVQAFSKASNLAGVYYHGINEPTTYNPGLENATFSLAPDTMVIYTSNDYSGTTMGLKKNWENDVHNVTKIDGYFVNVAHTVGGAVKVDKSIVPVGDTVTVDIMAYKNYALDTFAVTGADGNEITVAGDANTRTFAMPEGDVTITATFKSTIVPHVHSWSFEAEGTYINATCANTDGACHNPYQSVVMTPPSTKYFAWNLERTVTVSGTIEDVEIPEVVYTLKSTGEEVRPFEPDVYVASLTIENTTLTCEYEITKSNQLNYSFFTYTAPANLTYDGTAKIATVVPNSTVDAYIGDVEVLYNSSATPPINVGSYTVTFNVEESDYFTAKTNLSLGGRGGQKFSIVAKDIEDLTYTGLAASYPVDATPDVTIKYNGMTLVKDTDYTLVHTNNTTPGTATMTITGIGNYTGTKTLDFEITSVIYTVTVNDSIENGTVIADVSEAKEGETVTLTVTPAENYEIDTVSYNDGTSDVEITVTDGVYSFTMPASDVTVSAVFEQLAPITFEGAQIRTQGEQGLRFIFSMDKTYYETLTHPESNTQTGEGFGSILIPEVLLGDERLTKVNENVGIVPAVKLYEVTETTVSFTVCITSVPDYEREYVARAYVTDADGNTLYGECSEAISVFEIAELAYVSEKETAETKQYLLENVLNTVDPEKYPIA